MEGADYASVSRHIARAEELDPDIVVIDTPPALGPATWAAAHAARYVLIASEPGIESLERASDVIAIAEDNGRQPIIRILITKADRQTKLFRWMIRELDIRYPGHRLPVFIPHETAAAESAIFHMPPTVTAPLSKTAVAYTELAAEVLGRLNIERRAPAPTFP